MYDDVCVPVSGGTGNRKTENQFRKKKTKAHAAETSYTNQRLYCHDEIGIRRFLYLRRCLNDVQEVISVFAAK